MHLLYSLCARTLSILVTKKIGKESNTAYTSNSQIANETGPWQT